MHFQLKNQTYNYSACGEKLKLARNYSLLWKWQKTCHCFVWHVSIYVTVYWQCRCFISLQWSSRYKLYSYYRRFTVD
jgi:hypothetical protein